jgi:serine/threonine protein kinase
MMPLSAPGSQQTSSADLPGYRGEPRPGLVLSACDLRLTSGMDGRGRGNSATAQLGGLLTAGTTLGKYRIIRLLGEGGMGTVYEGLHVEIGKRVAIKIISPALAAIPEARARFLLEAQLTSRVRHPHTVDVTDICLESDPAFLVMEYLDGEDLAKHLRRAGPLPVEEVVDIALPILTAVAAAHDEGIVHRDLKPQNIFLAQMRDGTIQPKVLDFGISKGPALNPIRTSGAILGSPSYFAPEQVQDPKAISPASDQYALGVILYECVTGRLPYEGSNLAAIFQGIVMGSYQAPRAHRPDLPEDFERVITRAMSLAPADRFPDLRRMGRALLEFASPRTRLLWEDHLNEAAAPGSRSMESPSPVPVTDQTPGPERSPLAVTAWMPGLRPATGGTEPEPRPGWIPPVRSPLPSSSDPVLEVPRSFRPARWALGAGGLAVVAALIALVASHGRARSAAAIERPARSPAAATRGQTAPDVVHREASDEVRPAASARPVREARAAHRPRFGPNKAPLIE